MPPRVCIFARESLLHWSAFYVKAFRQACDTIAIGPATGPENHDFPDWAAVERYVVKNDIISDADDAGALLALLPEGWTPDLVVAIQSGGPVIAGIAELGCPTAYISVDTWHDPRDFVLAHQYDFVFLAQKGIAPLMRQMGCRHAFWLPLACDPEAHYAAEVPEEFDIAFIGSTHFMVNRQRVARLKRLEAEFKLGYAFGLGSDAMAEAYGRARLIFNASIAQDVNMRVFEALATGKPLVTNAEAAANGLFELFEDGRHLIAYTDDNLMERVRHALDHPDWAAAIGEAGRREALEKHTYVHRVRELLEIVARHAPGLAEGGARPRKSGQRVAEFVPWGARRLLDVGMGLDASRVALRRLGVEYVAAIAPDSGALERRGRSYDAAALLDPGAPLPGADYDAILWRKPVESGLEWDYVFNASTAALAEGGHVLFVLDEADILASAGELAFSALVRWMAPWRYRPLVWRHGSERGHYHLVVACQQTATPDEIVAQLYRAFPVNGVDTNPGVQIFSGEGPGSPGAGRP
ncbi:MAG: glycosyltransferase [Candidatus Hydrogenedentes bacterium]|nr:glycosyltransferase [Candidatus Hydrogenedentota bacterium]